MRINIDKFVASALLYSISGLSLILVLELLYFAFNGVDSSLQDAALLDLTEPQSLDINSMGSEEDFREIVDRPLFVWNRTPLPVSVEVTPSQVQTGSIESRWELTGIVAAGVANYAYFKPLDGEQRARLEEGMYFEDWKVQSIELEEVVLISGDSSSDSEKKVFRLKEMTVKPKGKSSVSRPSRRKPVGRAANVREPQTLKRRSAPSSAGELADGKARTEQK
jgi:hypothetical protein